MFGSNFLGKARIPHCKSTLDMAPVKMTPSGEVLLPLSQHIGAPAIPVVKVGDEVKVGQLIAEASGRVSSPIHSSVSGKVTKIDSCLLHNGNTVPAIRIESDGLMTVSESVVPHEVEDLDSFLEAVRASGVVGLGGAGFPAAAKLEAIKSTEIHTIIINCAECEPYLTSDARTILDNYREVFDGICLLERFAPSVEKFYFGIEDNKSACIRHIYRIFKDNPKVEISVLPSLYPQGAEKVLIHNTVGAVVPEGKYPADIGILVINVASLAAIARYIKTGMPLVERIVTVDGSAIASPKNVVVPFGTSIKELIEFTGGFKGEVGKILFGGPMMGITASSPDEPITKTVNGITALSVKDSTEPESTACIHCGRCVDTCPMNLNPTIYAKALNIENTEEKMQRLEDASLNLCMECGACSFVCPARRPLVQNIRLAKNALKIYKAHKANLK